MIVYARPVRFEEVDAAGILFFGRTMNFCHEAMENFFGALAGGYVDLIMNRKIGFPAVHVEADWVAPLRYGDEARIAVSVSKIGTTSCTFRYAITRAQDGANVATVNHVTVSTDLRTMTKVPLPPDVRTLLEAHASS